MATVAEQIFLFGEVLEPEPLTGFRAALEYADLMWSGSLAFTLVILLTIFAAYWESLAQVAVSITNLLLWAIEALTPKASWLLKQLLSLQFYTEFDALFYNVKGRIAMTISQSFPVRVMFALGGWYFPFNRSALTIIRLGCTFIGYMIVDSFFISPISVFLMIMRNDLRHMVLETKAYHEDMQGGDVHHLKAIVFVATLFSSFVFLWFLFENASNASAFHNLCTTSPPTQAKGNEPREPAQTITISATEAGLRATIRNCEAALKRERAAVVAANKRTEKVWNRLEKGIVSRIAAEESQSRAFAEQEKLRQQLVQKDCQLKMSRGLARDTEEEYYMKLDTLKARIAQLEGYLEDQIEENTQAENDLKAKIAELQEGQEKVRPDQVQVLVNQIAVHQERLDKRIKAEKDSSKDPSPREMQLMQQLKQKTQAEKDLRHQVDVLEGNFERGLDAARTRLREEQAQELSRLQQLSGEQEASTRQLANANIESGRQIDDLNEVVTRLKGEVMAIKGCANERNHRIQELEFELAMARHTLEKEADERQAREQPLRAREQSLVEKEHSLLSRQYSLLAKEQSLHAREQSLVAQEGKSVVDRVQPTNVDHYKIPVEGSQKHLEESLRDEHEEICELRIQVSELEEELKDNVRRIDMSMKDAQRSQQEVVSAQERIEDLERQLRNVQTPNDQRIPQLKTSNLKSMSTKFEESQLMVVKQNHTISELRRQLAQVQGAGGEPVDDREVEKLRVALANEERRRKTGEVQLQGANSKLFDENQNLKMKLSEAEAELEARVRGPRRVPGDPFIRARR